MLGVKPEFAPPGEALVSKDRPAMGPKSCPGTLACANRVDEVASDIQRKCRHTARACSKPQICIPRSFPDNVQCRRRRTTRGVYRKRSAVLGSLKLRKAA